jgi:threonine aldolase
MTAFRRSMTTVVQRMMMNHRCLIDLRSDTVTRPSRGMLAAAQNAETGDDVMGEDPTVNALEERVAELLGKPVPGLFFPTGTMANLCALTAHCDQRDRMEILVGRHSHLCLYEGGNVSSAASLHSRQINENPITAEFDVSEIMVRNDYADDHYCHTQVLCVENTHNMLGGIPLRLSYLEKVGAFCRANDMQLHMDGARLVNAVVATSISAVDTCRSVHSISLCLSKGLGAPLGSVLVGETEEFRRRAKRARKKYGGGMRQAGVVAAMGLYALQHHWGEGDEQCSNNNSIIALDHARARRLAERLQGTFVLTTKGPPPTNMVYFKLPDDAKMNTTDGSDNNAAFSDRLKRDYGVLLYGGFGPQKNVFRAVTHLDVSDEDIETAATAMLSCLQ